MIDALLAHAPEYAIEAALLGSFMISACCFGAFFWHPASPAARRIRGEFLRRLLMGIAMGATAVMLIYSPWGQRSGAHMNPATTLTFYLLGKVAPFDAIWYVVAQFLGGIGGVLVSALALRGALGHAAVNYVITAPGRRGAIVAWSAEVAIALGMMLMVLILSNDATLAPYTGFFVGALLCAYITLESPLSGMSLNPARTFASAIAARQWRAIWIYFTAPTVGMLAAAGVYLLLPAHQPVYCAKLAHCNSERCIFRCEIEKLRPSPAVLSRRNLE